MSRAGTPGECGTSAPSVQAAAITGTDMAVPTIAVKRALLGTITARSSWNIMQIKSTTYSGRCPGPRMA